MGAAYMAAAPSIDACVIGEADQVFVPVVHAMLSGKPLPAPPGILTRERLANVETIGRASYTASMDVLPAPNYDDYFDTLKAFDLSDQEAPFGPIFLPFEILAGLLVGRKRITAHSAGSTRWGWGSAPRAPRRSCRSSPI